MTPKENEPALEQTYDLLRGMAQGISIFVVIEMSVKKYVGLQGII